MDMNLIKRAMNTNNRLILFLLLCFISATCNNPSTSRKTTEPPVTVEPVLISQLGKEHFGNAVYRNGLSGPVIAISGSRILEFSISQSASGSEVVPPTTGRYCNGACSFDVNNDGIDEMIVGRTIENNGTDLIWFEEVAGQRHWKEHLIANVKSLEGDAEKGFHDIIPYELNISGSKVKGVAVVASRKRLYWFQINDDPAKPWKEHFIYDLSEFTSNVQSGLVSGDLSGDGKPDLICGNLWAECPGDPFTGQWKIHRYSSWDQRIITEYPGVPAWVRNERFGGMNQLAVGDLNNDGKPEIIAAEAEIPDARLGAFHRAAKDTAIWNEILLDSSLYCPHSLVAADVNSDGLADIIVGEMSAGGWMFPRNPNPRLYLFLNLGNLNFSRHVLHEGWGVHMMQKTRLEPGGRLFVFAADEIQSWYEDMTTNLVGWFVSPRK
jgi:hypothetical protein